LSAARALLMKTFVYSGIFGLIMPVLGGLSVPQAIVLALVHTLLLWLADQFLLLRLDTTGGLVVDALILALGTPLILGVMQTMPDLDAWILSTLIGLIFEWFFNRWLIDHDLVE
jgi:hypothetical protein